MREPSINLGSSGPIRVDTSQNDSSIRTHPAGFTARLELTDKRLTAYNKEGKRTFNVNLSPHHVKIYRVRDDSTEAKFTMPGIWMGRCRCGFKGQFHFWGATLGYMMQHQWKEMHY